MVKPWYKQFWPWFLIALPATVVVASFVTLGIFTKNSVSLVAEDYYKKGKGINIDLSRINVAKDLGLDAKIRSQDNNAFVSFDKGSLEHFPALIVTFTHRTLADRDFQQVVTANASGRYTILLDAPISGPWFVEIEPHNKEWLIQGKVTFPASDFIPLMK
ncbi:FixH family protein [Vibrio sp. SCSIO 43136]|uniref:FixH family protein n=1 Tax=Vibrio sp. SCSIO 43136 TaxID=2819101 RepID=UPI002075CA21|nr:FixH family protein [Vibrio sp. SCSIO 43136]USD66548.1 FixH family protein [Vibrio sp. SCSIO 43136]